MPEIRFDSVTKVFSTPDAPAVENVSLTIGDGELAVLLGPSGCGKTTLLRMINRLIEPTSGTISVGGRRIHETSATQLRRHIGYVIQQAGLFPHMSVASNIATVPRLLGWEKARINQRVDELLDLVDLPPAEYRSRYPRQLSGGQQQRVGIARAMAADPGTLLMDEPFGAIDAITREDLQNELLNIQRKVHKTIVFVTHDVEEALKLADRIVVMRSGRVVQQGTPLELLSHPKDDFVRALLDTNDVFRQLSLVTVGALMTPGAAAEDGPSVRTDMDVRTALSLMVRDGRQTVQVVDENGQPVGRLDLTAILTRGEAAENATAAG